MWSSCELFVARNTSPGAPPASHGRSPSWHSAVPVGQLVPPSGEENSESLTRSMPDPYSVPPASSVRSGSENPWLNTGLVKNPVPATSVRCQLWPLSAEVHMLTWFRYVEAKSLVPVGEPVAPER